MLSRCRTLAVACLCLWRTLALPALPVSLAIENRYDWPDRAEVRAALRQGALMVVARGDRQGADAGASLPWLTAGPLVGRGLIRLASDPLAFTPSSAVFEERTGLALDVSLRSSRRGVALMPLPGLAGMFARDGADGTAAGFFGCVPMGARAWVDALLQQSRPAARSAGDDWYLDRSPSPGGEMTHGCARMVADSGCLALSVFAGASSAAWAAPGGFAGLRLRGRLPAVEGAVLLCGVTPGYRSLDGNGTSEQSLVGAQVRLGEEEAGVLEGAWSFVVDRPPPVPGLVVPTRNRIGLAWTRRVTVSADLPLWLIVEGAKDVGREADGTRAEAARFSSAVALDGPGMEARAAVGFSGSEGARCTGEVALRPSSRMRLALEARADHLGTDRPDAASVATLALWHHDDRHAVEVGVVDWPLRARGGAAPCFRLALTTSVRLE